MNSDLRWLIDDSSETEEQAQVRKVEQSELAIIRADYQWIAWCQQASDKELQQTIDEGPWNDEAVRNSFEENKMAVEGYSPPLPMDDEMKAHYLKRYRQAQIVWEARGLGKV